MTLTQPIKKSGFTLMETVIAIGVLAVLLTAFMAVFGPAAANIRRAINVQEADRLASTLERELVTLRDGQESASIKIGFDKAFDWIAKSQSATDALFIYQYRGDPDKQRSDGTLEPLTTAGGVAGKDYIVQPMVRRLSDTKFLEDVKALQGPVFVVKCTQLVFKTGELQAGDKGKIADPKGGATVSSAEQYPEAVIAFSAEFHGVAGNNAAYFSGTAFKTRFDKMNKPVFTRNLAVRR
jgi:prepilin-type N-terminal cleavage/methylation domain-containing protein